jgi:DNA polymerase III gamma/tau subunit
MLAALESGDYRTAMDIAEALASSPEETLRFLSWVQSWYRDLLVLRFLQDSAEIVNLDMLPELRRQQAEVALGRILSAAAQAGDAVRKIQRNLNRRMVLEQFLFGAVGSR